MVFRKVLKVKFRVRAAASMTFFQLVGSGVNRAMFQEFCAQSEVTILHLG